MTSPSCSPTTTMRTTGTRRGEYALRVYTVDTLNTNFARPCFALGERKFDPEMEDVSGAIENTLH